MNTDNLNQMESMFNRSMNERNYFATYYLLAIINGSPRKIFEARFYGTDSGTIYCAAWINLDGKRGHASGKAGGWGYDKLSAALASALKNMGVTDMEPISGRGMNCAMEVIRKGLEPIVGTELFKLESGA